MDELEKYYEYLKSKGADLPPTVESFRTTLADDKSARTYYDYVKKSGFDAPDTYESFANTFKVKKKEQETPSQEPSTISATPPSPSPLPQDAVDIKAETAKFEQENPDHSEYDSFNPIDLAKQADELSKKEILLGTTAGTGGGAPNLMPDTEARDKAKSIKEYLKKNNLDAEGLNKTFEDFNPEWHNIEGFDKSNLVDLIKANPSQAQRKIAAAKWQIPLVQHVAKTEGGAERLNYLIQKAQNQDTDYASKRESNRELYNIIATSDAPNKEKILENFAIDHAYGYGTIDKNNSELQKEKAQHPLLNENQLIALDYLKDVTPDKVAGFEAALIDPTLLKDNFDAQMGQEEKLKRLEEIGISLRENSIRERLKSLENTANKLLENVVASADELPPDERVMWEDIQRYSAPLQEQLAEINNQKGELLTKYPKAGIHDAELFAQELLGQKHTGLDWFAIESGRATENAAQSIFDLVATPFASDEQTKIRQNEILGNEMNQRTSTNLVQKNLTEQTFVPTIKAGSQLEKYIEEVKKNTELSEGQKKDAITVALMRSPDEWQRTPNEKSNIGLTSLMYGTGQLAAFLAPFILVETATGGGATAGFAKKFTSTFTSMMGTSYHDALVHAIDEGVQDPYSHAMRVTAINSAAMAGAGTPAAIKKLLTGTKSAAADLVMKMTDGEIVAALKKEPAAMSTFRKAMNVTKNVGTNAAHIVKDGVASAAKIQPFMTAGQVLNDAADGRLRKPEDYMKQAAVEALKFSILGTATGMVRIAKEPTDINKAALYQAATDPNGFFEAVRQKEANGSISTQEASQIRTNIRDAADVFKTVPFVDAEGKSLGEKARRDLLILKLREKQIQNSLTRDIPSGLKEKLKEDLSNTKEKIETIYEEPLQKEGEKTEAKVAKTEVEGDNTAVEKTTEVKVEDNITVGELIDNPINYNGKRARLYQDGQTVVAKIEGENREYELGNIEQVKGRSISEFGIEHETSVVGVNEKGNIVVREQEYVNNYSDPKAAINFDKDGNIVSVNLETAEGKKRTFKGSVAEDIAYQIHLKEINKNNETKSEFEDFINADESISKQINDAAVSATAPKESVENIAAVQRTKAEPKKPTQIKEEPVSTVPKIGDEVNTPNGKGVIDSINSKGAAMVKLEDGSTMMYTPKLWEGKAETTEAPLSKDAEVKTVEDAVRKMDEVENYTFQDMVKDVEHLANESGNQKIIKAVEDYRKAQAEDTKLSGRGDMDSAEKAFLENVKSEPIPAEVKEVVEPPKPPSEPPPAEPPKEQGEGSKKQMNDKGVLTHLATAEKIPQESRKGFEEKGLKYEPQSREEAEQIGKSMVDKYGIDDAVMYAEGNKFKGGVNSAIFAESLDRLYKQEAEAKTPAEKLDAAKKFSEIGIRYDEFARGQGRDISQIGHFYKKSPLGIQMMENARRKEEFENWAKPKEKEWKEVFDEMMKEPEFEAVVKEQVREGLKKERAEARKARIKKVDEFFDKAINQFKGGATYSTIIPPQVITLALKGMKEAYHAGEKVAKIIEDAVDYISNEMKGASWDKDKFRIEWTERLKDSSERKPLTDAELKARVLERFRNKLKGLSDKQKEEVVTKSFKKIVESGGLDYADFRKIISDVTGRGEMTEVEAAKLRELVTKANAVEDAGKVAREERTQEARLKFREAEKEASKASRELNIILNTRPNITKRLTSMLQLNTLGIAALVNNPIYNLWNQVTLRAPVGLVKTGIDQLIYQGGKLFGKEFLPETNVLRSQREFFQKLGLGSREAIGQFVTGLNRMDYTQKEVYGQQIRPIEAMKDLWAYHKGEKNLTKKQVVDKALQALPQGWTAEIIARTLNLGDKPQRFAAEGSQAAAFAKSLGLKDIDYDLFVDFPREEAYRVYKQRGLSDVEAGKKADYVKDTIIKEGERSTFQQDNFANDMLNKIFGGKDSGTGGLLKAAVVSPYIKIPTNAYWSYFNIVNPEAAMIQSAIYGAKAWMKRNGDVKFSFDKSNTTAAKDLNESKYWLAHAAVGFATRAVVASLVGAGIYRSSNTGEDTKKEREGEQAYEQPGTMNVSKLWAWMQGEDPSKVKNGLLIQNRWFGHWGSVGNTIARREEEMTPEQKENRESYWAEMLDRMGESGVKELQQGIFANTTSLLSALSGGVKEFNMKSWGLNTVNMLTNVAHPAVFAQMSKAELPYYTKTKADSFLGEIKNAALTRSSWLRKLTGEYPPAKIGIWGDKIEKNPEGSWLYAAPFLFGISKANDDNFAQPIYEDYKRTNNTRFFPSAVMPSIKVNGETFQLKAAEADELAQLVGSARKELLAPYANNMATFEGSDGRTYSELSDEEKIDKLNIVYEIGYQQGKALFLERHPEYNVAKEDEKVTEEKKESSSNKQFRSAVKKTATASY